MTVTADPITRDPETGQATALRVPCTLGSLSTQKTKEAVGLTVHLSEYRDAVDVLLGAQLEVVLTKADPDGSEQASMFPDAEKAPPRVEGVAEFHSVSIKPAGGQGGTLSFQVGAVDHDALRELANGEAFIQATRIGAAGDKAEEPDPDQAGMFDGDQAEGEPDAE